MSVTYSLYFLTGSAACPNGGPPIFGASVLSSSLTLTFEGINASQVDEAVMQSIINALAASLTGVDPNRIIVRTNSSRRRASLLTVFFDIVMGEDSVQSSLDSLKAADFSSKVAQHVSDNTGFTIAGATVLREPSVRSAVDEQKRLWEYDENLRLIGCPKGFLVFNTTPETSTCSQCAYGSYSVNSTDTCGKSSWLVPALQLVVMLSVIVLLTEAADSSFALSFKLWRTAVKL